MTTQTVETTTKTTKTATPHHSIVKYYAVGKVASTIRSVETTRRDATISALYHSLIKGNVAFLDGFTRADTAMFDSTLRTLLPVQWRWADAAKTRGTYEYNKTKGAKVLAKFELAFADTTFEAFADAMLDYWMTNNQATKQAEIDAQTLHDNAAKRFQKQLEQAFGAGLTVSEIENAVILFKQSIGLSK